MQRFLGGYPQRLLESEKIAISLPLQSCFFSGLIMTSQKQVLLVRKPILVSLYSLATRLGWGVRDRIHVTGFSQTVSRMVFAALFRGDK